MTTPASTKQSNVVLVRLPNWIGDTCMCLPALDLLSQSGVPFVVCARGWAKSLLSGLRTEGFIEMKDSLKANVQALRDWRQTHPSHQHALLMPDSLSSALTFRLAGFQSVGWRDDGRSLLLKWPQTKPAEKLHAVQAWFELTKRALQCWGYDTSQVMLRDSVVLPITNEHKQSAAAALREAGLKSGDFVLKYNPKQMMANVEKIKLESMEDAGIEEKWGDNIYRINLEVIKPKAKDQFNFTVMKKQ